MELKSFDDLKEKKSNLLVLWKILSKINLASGRVMPLQNDLLFVLNNGQSEVDALYCASSTKVVAGGLCYIHSLQKGYLFAGYDENEIGLFSPKGNLLKIFLYDKKLYSECREYSKAGVKYCLSGFSFLTKFFFVYDTVALRCADKCYIAKVAKFNPKNAICVGKYEDIAEMKDSVDGKVYVRYNDGNVKLFDSNLKEMKLDVAELKKIIFLENGSFIARDFFGEYYVFDKSGKVLSSHRFLSATEYSRFYKLSNGQIYDCYTHSKFALKNVPILKSKDVEVFYDNGSVFCYTINKGKRTKKYILIKNCPSCPRVVDNKYLYFNDDRCLFVINPLDCEENILDKILNYLSEIKNDEDISIDLFLYLTKLCEYMYGTSHSLKKMLYNFVNSLN